MGSYRLLLAFCVFYSHTLGNVFGKNIGVAAVISFFVMSGFWMTRVVAQHYPRAAAIPMFYLDRIARLFPQFLLYLALTVAFLAASGHAVSGIKGFDPVDIALNALMLPLGYAMYLDRPLFMPQAWSLGLELTFYLVFPFLFLLPGRWKWIVFWGSIGVAAAAFAGVVNTDWYGYRLLPGTLFIFLAGASLTGLPMWPRALPVVAFAIGLCAAVVTLVDADTGSRINNVEISIGLMVGIAVVALLRSVRSSKLDELLGDVSYGVFLNHNLVYYIFQYLDWSLLWMPPVSIAAALASFYGVERPVLQWRRRFRAREASVKGLVQASAFS